MMFDFLIPLINFIWILAFGWPHNFAKHDAAVARMSSFEQFQSFFSSKFEQSLGAGETFWAKFWADFEQMMMQGWEKETLTKV